MGPGKSGEPARGCWTAANIAGAEMGLGPPQMVVLFGLKGLPKGRIKSLSVGPWLALALERKDRSAHAVVRGGGAWVWSDLGRAVVALGARALPSCELTLKCSSP